MLQASRKHNVAIQPAGAWSDLRERHADLKGGTCLLGENGHRTERSDRGRDGIEQRANVRSLAAEVMREIIHAARVRLVAIRKGAVTLRTTPERRQVVI